MKTNLAIICVLAQSIIYGFGDPISKYAFEIIPVYPALVSRYLIASIFLLLIAYKPIWQRLRSDKIQPLLLPSVCIGLAYLVGNVAITLTEATTVAFLRSLTVVFTPILAFVFYKIPYSWKHAPILVFIVIGLYLLCGMAENGLTHIGWGEILSLASALLIAGALVFGQKALSKSNPLTLTAVQTFVTTAVVILAACFVPQGFQTGSGTLTAWSIIVYIAIACTVGGYLLQNTALEYISSRSVALIQCICPVLTAFFSYIILGETLSFLGLVGAILILISIVAETIIQK